MDSKYLFHREKNLKNEIRRHFVAYNNFLHQRYQHNDIAVQIGADRYTNDS